MSPETSSARDGTGNGRPTELASSVRSSRPQPGGQLQTSSASRRRPASANTDQPPSHRLRQDPPFPWHVSPAQPAILTSVANIWAGVQDLMLKVQGASPPGLRGRVAGKMKYSRNEGPLDALVRPIRVQSSDAETRHIHTGTESSAGRELATIRNSSPNDPSRSQLRQRSVGPQGRSVERSVENGPRRSARLGAHLPRGPSTSAPPRRTLANSDAGYIDSGNQYVDPGKLKSISGSCISPGKYTLAPGAFTNLQENQDLLLGSCLYIPD
ncbi:hypothetical protein PCH_Pc17g00860 [Penicillium rubens Wisconsin 54-1255]|uniref:Uncharacterized protein n=1 Tax=Penicillium rubens (strain ATCC 28089 / DSM 1075 / NRRL 1951 / Wisconsin 54-1255) TaxID=500485 RepID=B6HB06_PENRW|nr:hypothetical protein PCH_Pc17g00860 [Penicillium rubens Wisconsin 54-1255]